MTDNFWNGFEKQAGVPGFIGSLVGGSRAIGAKATKAVKAVPAQVKAIPGKVKTQIAANKREFDVMKRKGMGPEQRKLTGAASKPLDLSQKAQQGQLAKAKGLQTPAAIAREKEKNSLINQAKNLARVSAVAGAGGVYLGTRGEDAQQQ